MNIKIKRIYEQAEKEDGYRILTDRLWPRGIKKEKTQLDEWNKDIAPSADLRKWFDHQQERFEKFAGLYRSELQNKKTELLRIKKIAEDKNVTLLYAGKDTKINHAIILQDYLKNQIK